MLVTSITIVLGAIYFVSTVNADTVQEYHATTEQALLDAYTQAKSGDIIIIDDNIQLTSQLTINKNITLKGSADQTITLNNSQADVRHIYSTTGLTIENLIFDGNGGSGGIKSSGYLTIKDCEFNNNASTISDGGAVYASGGLTLEDSHFTNNTASSSGGAVNATGGAEVRNCTFTDNSLTNSYWSEGGALAIQKEATVSNSAFINNTASIANGTGGAISIRNGDAVSISNSSFKKNSAGKQGGAVMIKTRSVTTPVTLDNCSFETNSSANGGAVSTFYGGRFTNCEFSGNTGNTPASEINVYGGGAIYANDGPVIIKNSILENNSSNGPGGAISTLSDLTATQCIFTGNKSTDPSKIYGNGGATFSNKGSSIDQCVFTNNAATGLGGATYAHADSEYTNSTFDSNMAGEAGAIIQCYSDALVTNCTFYKNAATINQNGTYSTYGSGTFEFTNSTFLDNASLGGSNLTNFYHSIVDEVPASPLPWEVYTSSIGYLGVETDVFSQATLLSYDTKVPVGLTTNTETLKLGYVPIKPNGLADNQITVAENTGVPPTDSLGTTKGTPLSDIGAFEEQGILKNEIVSGDNQSAAIETPYAEPLVIQSFYQSNIQPLEIPLANKAFNVTAPASGASAALSAQMIATDSTGKASVHVTANSIEGSYQVNFTDTEDTTQTLSFSLTSTPKIEKMEILEIVSGNNQSSSVESEFKEPLVIRAFTTTSVDETEVPLANKSYTVTTPTAGASGTLSAQTVTTDSAGNASVNVTANSTEGSYQVIFTDALDSQQSLHFSLTNTAKPVVPSEQEIIITEKYVDSAGNALAGQEDTTTKVRKDDSAGYSKEKSNLPTIADYTYLGFKLAGETSKIALHTDDPISLTGPLNDDITITFVYGPDRNDPGKGDVTTTESNNKSGNPAIPKTADERKILFAAGLGISGLLAMTLFRRTARKE